MSHSKSAARQGQGTRGQARTTLREALSAAVDGEASELELRRVVNALGADADLRAEWERTHAIGATMRGVRARKPLPVGQRPWLQDAAEHAAPLARWTRWAWPAAGAAAAAVAALAVVFAFAPPGQPTASVPAVASAPAASAGAPTTSAGARDFRHLASVPSHVDLQRTNTYMLRHVHQTSLSRTGAAPMAVGTVPFVKVLAVRDGRTHAADAAPSVGDRADR